MKAVTVIKIENEKYELEEMSNDALAGIYAGMAQDVGDKVVTRFRDKETAIRRVLQMHEKWTEAQKEVGQAKKAEVRSSKRGSGRPSSRPKSSTPRKVSSDRKVRQKYFKFPVEKQIRQMRPDTLRFKMAELLRGGATFEACVKLTEKFDVARVEEQDKVLLQETIDNAPRRAYECIRLLHYYIGYGIDQPDGPNGKIFLVEKKA